MSIRRIPAAIEALLLAAALLACGPSEDAAPVRSSERSDRLSVYVVNAPLAYFAERIGGESVDVVLPAPPDVDPAFWMPDPEVVAGYQRADVILKNGAGYARWTEQASLPRKSVVDTSAAVGDRLLPSGVGATHGHGPQGEHSHEGLAFTTWLDPTIAREQAVAIAEAFARLRPAAAADFRAGLRSLEADLADLDQELRDALAPLSDRPVLFSHPVYQYLARRYGLEGDSLSWEPGVMPDAAEWRALEGRLERQPVGILFFEGEPHPEAVSRLQALGVETIVFAPAANRPTSGDWLSVMRDNVARLEAVGPGTGAGVR